MQKTRQYSEEEIKDRQRILFGERYVGKSISSLRSPEWAQIKIAEFMQKQKHFLVFCGNPGIGKTNLCASLVGWAMNNFRSFRYWNESELLKRVRSSMDDTKGDYLETLKYCIDDELVMLDDIGSTGLNEWRKEIIFDAIDERYNSMLPTILTSNFTRHEFETKFHPRIASRIFDKDNILIEIHDGLDMRME